tara:strand:- start:407 stop:1117 length:711 start_codon:yes stop_codon:yes gene_type:complete
MTNYNLRIAKDDFLLSHLVKEVISDIIIDTLNRKDRCQISLAGGSTPEQAYILLAKEDLPWSKVDVFLGDERWVDHSSDLSNAFMLERTLFSSSFTKEARFFRVPTLDCSTPEESAFKYQSKIQSICSGSPPSFDLVLLGLGEDGHTASLFPGDNVLNVEDKIVSNSIGKGIDRITLTASTLSAAKKVIFLVSGAGKKQSLQRLLDNQEPSDRTPAKLVQTSSEILVLSDESAATI